MYDGIDLEDIECRLYSQIYHSCAENEEINSSLKSRVTLNSNSKIRNNRYFSIGEISDQSTFIPLEGENINRSDNIQTLVHNTISFNPTSTDINTEGNFSNQFQNNITVNQYTLPLILNSELGEVCNPSYGDGRFFIPWYVENGKLLDKKNRKQQKRLENRRRKNREKRIQNNSSGTFSKIGESTRRNVNNIIVYVSDDSDNECVVISEMPKKTLKSKKLNPESSKILDDIESDSDDIIYIPPPPIEVINVDIEAENENICGVSDRVDLSLENISTSDLLLTSTTNHHSGDPHELSNTPESCTSNDFLDNTGVENNTIKFNFDLHGSDFKNTGDFLRPPNPVDYCETESSCSTNDYNRENNSVKTVVFNEVDFPKEDIFSDKNLEGFSTYITPKRNVCKTLEVIPSKSPKPANKILNENESSSSSSESDYEPPNINKNIVDLDSNKRLPTLSPMQCDKKVISKIIKKQNTKKLDTDNLNAICIIKKHSSKRKSNTLEVTESDSDGDKEVSTVNRKISKKKKKASIKKRSCSEDSDKNITNEELQNKGGEAKKDVNYDTDSVCETIADDSVYEVSVQKKKKNSSEKIPPLDNEESLKENTIENPQQTKNVNTEHYDKPASEDVETTNTNILKTSQKKKKKTSAKKNEIDNTSNSSSNETVLGKVKRKKKKSLSTNNSVNDINITELNRSWVGIGDIENELLNSKYSDTADDNKKNGSFSKTESETHNKGTISYTENLQGNVNEVLPNISSLPSVHVYEEIKSDEEFIIVDEVISNESDLNVEIVVSSDSECDFSDLRDVGQDIKLANCSLKVSKAIHSNDFIDTDYVSRDFTSYIMNKNLCKDYSKFDVEQIQSTQSDDPETWKILPSDKYMFLNTGVNRGPRCNRCRQFGHIAARCTESPPKCSLCGFSDHQEPRCPNKRCTQCGNEGDYSTTYCWKCFKFRKFVCRICNMTGHVAKNCPDLWRRYHLTTQEGPIVVCQEPQSKPRDQLWCSGCAGQGHLEHECNYYNREYPPTTPYIISYEDVFRQQDGSTDRLPTPESTPPQVLNLQEPNGFYRNITPLSFHNTPSTSQGIINNAPIFIPPLMSQMVNLNSLFSTPTMLGQNEMAVQNSPVLGQNEMIVPSNNMNCNPNFTPASTKVLNPFSALVKQVQNPAQHKELDQMMLDYVKDGNNVHYIGNYNNDTGKVLIPPHLVNRGTNEFLKNDQRRIKRIIMSMPCHEVKQFLSKELAELENVVSQSDPRYLKRKLFKYEKMSNGKKALKCEVVKEKCFWYRIVNMFIFGVHKFRDGKVHINYIRKYVSEPKQHKLDTHKRKSLLNAYNYIFEGDRHVNVNYYKIMQKLIHRNDGENFKND